MGGRKHKPNSCGEDRKALEWRMRMRVEVLQFIGEKSSKDWWITEMSRNTVLLDTYKH